jgi:hypothetical protein
LLDAIQALGFDARISVEVDQTEGDYSCITMKTQEGHVWIVPLGYEGPYFQEIEIQGFGLTSENPHRVADYWNQGDHLCVATVVYDLETDIPKIEEDAFIVRLRLSPLMSDDTFGSRLQESISNFEIEFEEFIEFLSEFEAL